MSTDILGRRALGRATLARQLLLERDGRTPLAAAEHLVGLQAQVPQNPYLALWSRLADFDPHEMSDLIEARRLVRIVLMRGTIHLVTAEDCLDLRRLFQPVLDAELTRHPQHGPALAGVDLTDALAIARSLLRVRPRTMGQLREGLAAQCPGVDAAALAYACRNHLPLVQIPPRGLWRRSAQVTYATAEDWLGHPLSPDPSIGSMVLRYLAAFGPATVADATTWTRLTGLREVFERLRPELRTFRDERGRELFDLPEAPRPDPDTPAPACLLPEYDNVLLSHADRSRFTTEGARTIAPTGPVRGTVLDDGVVLATWHVTRDGPGKSAPATLVIDSAPGLSRRRQDRMLAEARRAASIIAPESEACEVTMVADP